MKLVIAMIQPHKLPDVKKELLASEIHKMTVTNVLGCGQQKGYSEAYRGVIHEVNLLKKIRLEIAVNEEFLTPRPERSGMGRSSFWSCRIVLGSVQENAGKKRSDKKMISKVFLFITFSFLCFWLLRIFMHRVLYTGDEICSLIRQQAEEKTDEVIKAK